MDDSSEHCQGVHPWGCRRLPPGPATRQAPGVGGISADSRTSLLAATPSTEEALCDPRIFAFVTLHLFSTGGWHLSAVAELLCLIERLEELYTEVQGMIS